uniref:Uncharacterized protein n=1 Tax=Oryza brachyantha TaxID=4533 RepID=J3M548_ORYBR
MEGKGQENAADLGAMISVEGLGGVLRQPEVGVVAIELPPQLVQEPANRGRDDAIVLEANCLGKKRRSAGATAVEGLGGVLRQPEVGVVAIELPPQLVQEPANRGRDDAIVLEANCLGKKRRSAAATACEHPTAIAREAATAAIPEGARRAVDQVLTKMQQLLKHGSGDNAKNMVRPSRNTSDVVAVGEKELEEHMKQATVLPQELKDLHSQQTDAACGKITN